MSLSPSRFAQTPLDNKLYTIDYSQWLGATERLTLVTYTVQQTTSPPFNITNTAVSPDGKSASFYASGGLDGTTYEIEVIATTSLSQTKNDQIFFAVRAR